MLIARRNMMRVGKRGYTAKSYVQDGLIIQLDAIENFAYGEFRELTNRWYDLVSGGYLGMASTPLRWEDGYVTSDSQNGFNNTSSTITIPSDVSDYTVEYILREHTCRGAATTFFPKSASCRSDYNDSRFGNFISFGTKNSTSNSPYGGANGLKYSVDELKNATSLVVINQGGHGRYIIDYKYDKQTETESMGDAAGKNFIVGGVYAFNFKYNAARMYRRALINAELEYNRSIDVARFNLPDAQ